MRTGRLLSTAALTGALCLAQGCGSQNGPEPGPAVPEFPSFVREPAERAVITSGTAGWPSFAADPSVVADSEGYHLFYTTLFCRRADGSFFYSWDPQQTRSCSLTGAWGATAYAFSRDRGLTWEFRPTPVVPPGAGEWNKGDIETPFVCRVGDRLYLFYSALGTRPYEPQNYRYQLGAATLDLAGRSIRQALLSTAETFTHHALPLVAADFSQRHAVNNAQEPSVVVRDGRLELFFVSLGLALPDKGVTEPGQEVSVALRATTFGLDLSAIEPPTAPLVAGASANIAEVRYFDGRYHLFATTTELDDHENDVITYASSEDGRHFTAPAAILRRGNGGAFDNWGLMAPAVVVEPESVLLFYTGWEMQEHACLFGGAGGRLGMSPESRPMAALCLYPSLGRAISARTKPRG